ncbi:helix-turn-helix domain-containing protein [Micromonospora haikouensis]|uniref:helix-turn-helix domain-containing protein n=1 Tax=Micromonospora haikouensis TaxID=686309 RepID=UPI003D742478
MSIRLLKVTEVAALWGVDKQTVYRAIWSGDLPYVDLAKPGARKARLRVRESAAEAYVESRETPAKGHAA